jgi:hypothetical protein
VAGKKMMGQEIEAIPALASAMLVAVWMLKLALLTRRVKIAHYRAAPAFDFTPGAGLW